MTCRASTIAMAAQTRLGQGLLCRTRLAQPIASTFRRPLLRLAAQARRGSMDASLDLSNAAEVEALEQLYLSADMAPEQLTALTSTDSRDAHQHQQRMLASAKLGQRDASSESTCREDSTAVTNLPPASASAADGQTEPLPEGPFSRLLDLLPLSKRTRGIVMLNLLVMLVATNWVVVKDVGVHYDPFGFAFLRFAVAAAAFSPFMKAASKDKRIMAAGIELGIWTAAGYITQSAGLLTTDASRASFLSTFTVLVVPFLAGVTGKGVSPVTWASCVAALVGVGLLEQGGAPAGIGDIWSFLSAVAFGVQVFRTEHHARILGAGSNLSLMSVVLTTTMVFSALAAGMVHPDAVMDMLRHPAVAEHLLSPDQFPWRQVLYTGLLTTDLALAMEIFALQDVSSVEAAVIYTLEPVLGAAMAWVMLGERLGAKGFLGAAIILASSLVTQVMGGRKEGEEGASAQQTALPSKDD